MHLPTATIADEPASADRVPQFTPPTVKFLSLELTNRCNLKCVHCYTESTPESGADDLMSADDYESVMLQVYALGCRVLQFIGGEAQLSPDFYRLLKKSKSIGFEYIEVFTNLTRLPEEVLNFAAENDIKFATSVYSDDSQVHDAVTRVRSSHTRTVTNLKRLTGKGVESRAAIIKFEQSEAAVERTRTFLKDIGVKSVRASQVREFGRGEEIVGGKAHMAALCGHCWDSKLCVAPNGAVYPCVMARQWPVGNIFESSLAEIIGSRLLKDTREKIYDEAWKPRISPTLCGPCPQSCDPSMTSCVPNETMCEPFSCPQSCDPLGYAQNSDLVEVNHGDF